MEEAQECRRLIVMAQGRVVAAGSAAEIIGQSKVIVVQSDSWVSAFRALDAAGLPAALVGRSLRVPGASRAEVASALAGVPSRLTEAPATLEERFFELVRTRERAG
jgi:ABC-type multidrug transport system ATPase subunit